jgi:hypothetical protein
MDAASVGRLMTRAGSIVGSPFVGLFTLSVSVLFRIIIPFVVGRRVAEEEDVYLDY